MFLKLHVRKKSSQFFGTVRLVLEKFTSQLGLGNVFFSLENFLFGSNKSGTMLEKYIVAETASWEHSDILQYLLLIFQSTAGSVFANCRPASQ